MRKIITVISLVIFLSSTNLFAQTPNENWVSLKDYLNNKFEFDQTGTVYSVNTNELKKNYGISINTGVKKIAYKQQQQKNSGKGILTIGTLKGWDGKDGMATYTFLDIDGKFNFKKNNKNFLKSKELSPNNEGWKIYSLENESFIFLLKELNKGLDTEILSNIYVVPEDNINIEEYKKKSNDAKLKSILGNFYCDTYNLKTPEGIKVKSYLMDAIVEFPNGDILQTDDDFKFLPRKGDVNKKRELIAKIKTGDENSWISNWDVDHSVDNNLLGYGGYCLMTQGVRKNDINYYSPLFTLEQFNNDSTYILSTKLKGDDYANNAAEMKGMLKDYKLYYRPKNENHKAFELLFNYDLNVLYNPKTSQAYLIRKEGLIPNGVLIRNRIFDVLPLIVDKVENGIYYFENGDYIGENEYKLTFPDGTVVKGNGIDRGPNYFLAGSNVTIDFFNGDKFVGSIKDDSFIKDYYKNGKKWLDGLFKNSLNDIENYGAVINWKGNLPFEHGSYTVKGKKYEIINGANVTAGKENEKKGANKEIKYKTKLIQDSLKKINRSRR